MIGCGYESPVNAYRLNERLKDVEDEETKGNLEYNI